MIISNKKINILDESDSMYTQENENKTDNILPKTEHVAALRKEESLHTVENVCFRCPLTPACYGPGTVAMFALLKFDNKVIQKYDTIIYGRTSRVQKVSDERH